MTCGRFWLFSAALVSAVLALSAGCGGGNAPCTNCPPIEGRYALAFAPGDRPAECVDLGVQLPTDPLEIQRAGSQLTATLQGVTMQGTLYQTYDFNLAGTKGASDAGVTTNMSLSGRFSPAVTDGGVAQIVGTFNGTYQGPTGQGTRRCSLSRPYTATPAGGP
jgi:hypothetical protein